MGTIFKEAWREDTHLPFLISHYLSLFYIFPLRFSHSYKNVRKYPDEINEREWRYFRSCCRLLTAQILGAFWQFLLHSQQPVTFFGPFPFRIQHKPCFIAFLTPVQNKKQCPVLKETQTRLNVAVSLIFPHLNK